MTGISPLQSFHKKGLFGDHHAKNEKDLIQVSEIKGFYIFQIVKYKKAKVNLNEIHIDGVRFSEQNLKVESNTKTRILWMGPRTWFIVSSKEEIIQEIKKKLSTENFAVTDISHSRAVIQIKGNQAKEILKKGCPINLNDFKKNNCASTVFQGINILIDMLEDKPETFNLYSLRSFGETFYHDITDASLEFGYVGV